MVMLCLGLLSRAALETTPAHGEPAAVTRMEVDALKSELERLRQEVADLRASVVRRVAQPTPRGDAPVTVRLANQPMLGAPEAPLTLVDFSDYQCPYCRRFHEQTWPALKRDYIDTGKLRYVFRDFPLDRIHPQARKAAEAAHCAGEQGHYWAMHALLFQHQQALQVEHLKRHARQLGLNASAFETCLEQGTYAAAIQQNLEDGLAAGVQGTPGFFLGKTRPDGIIQGTFIRGAQPLAAFQQAIERLLTANE